MTNLRNTITGLASWLDDTQLKSGDPFALQCSNMGIRFGKISPLYIGTALSKIDQRYPWFSNAVVPHKTAPQSAGIYAQSCILMDKYENGGMWNKRAKKWIDWLLHHTNKKYGYVWGIPFPWLMGTGVLAPENIPMATVAPYGSDAFYLASKWHNKKCLSIALSNAEFITTNLNHTYEDETKLCLSYSPLDNFHITNVQAYCASQLYRAYLHTGISVYRNTAEKLVNYILSEQNEDGSWYYWSSHEPIFLSIDSLHQCYIMQGLYRSYLVSRDPKIYKSVIRCMNYCKENLITEDLYVKKFPVQKHPYELIDAAEMVSTMDMIGDKLSEELLDAAIKNFTIWNENFCGVNVEQRSFASRINPRNNIPYTRWGQTQMLFTMVQHLILKTGKMRVEVIYT